MAYPNPYPRPAPDPFIRRWLFITACIAALMLLWQFLPAIEAWFSPREAAERTVTARGDLAADEKATIELFEKSRASVVYITTAQLVRAALDHAIKRARHGHGGTVIEAVTYRLSDHTTADDARRYRPDDEVKAAWDREPLKRLRAYLTTLNAWTDKEEDAWKADCATRVDAEVNAYLETKSQPVEAIFDFTYAEVPADLAAQRRSAIDAEKEH